MPVQERFKYASQMWKKISVKDMQKYREMAEQDQQRYEEDVVQYHKMVNGSHDEEALEVEENLSQKMNDFEDYSLSGI